ncbi:MAG TPA: hypothetical protein VJB02_06760, partial [Coxiellaceae bacterium]|nr:hypothetical protein [Coxiellaceae bacterium]
FVEDWAAWFTVPNAAAAARGEVPGAAAAGAAAPAAAPALEKAPTGLLRPAEVSDVRRWGDQEQREELICLIRQAYCKFEQQAGANGLHLNETIRQLILRQRGEGGIALARPPYRLEAFKPDDVLSAIMSGGENFIDFLQLYYESSPSIALYASAIYLACGFAAIHPKAFLKLSKQLKFFTEWSASTARVMARKEASRFVSAAFMNFKEMLLTLEGLTDGNNALLGHIIAYTRDNPAPVMVGLGAALGFGELLAALPANIPEVSDDKGTVPFFMGAFAVAKGSAVAYEGLASETGERSIVGRTFDLILRTSSWALRFALLLTPIGWILGAIYGKTFIAKPFEELVYGLAWLLLRLTHVITRALKLVGRVVRTFFKTVTEWIFNNTATVMKHPRLVVLLGLGVLVGMLAHVGVVYSLLIGLLGIGVGLVLSLAIPPNPNMTRSRAFNMARLMVGLALLGTAAAVKLGVLSFGFLPTLGAGEFGKVAMLTLVLGVSMVVLSAVVVGVVKAIERSRGKRTGDWAGDMVQVKHQVHREAARMTQSLNAANRYVQNSVARAHCDRSDRILPRTYARADREQFDVPSQMIALPPERRPEF